MGSSNSCGFREFLSGSQDEANPNAENVWRLSEFQDVVTQFLREISTDADEKFFPVKNELAALNAIQAEMVSTQNRKRIIIHEPFDAFVS